MDDTDAAKLGIDPDEIEQILTQITTQTNAKHDPAWTKVACRTSSVGAKPCKHAQLQAIESAQAAKTPIAHYLYPVIHCSLCWTLAVIV